MCSAEIARVAQSETKKRHQPTEATVIDDIDADKERWPCNDGPAHHGNGSPLGVETLPAPAIETYSSALRRSAQLTQNGKDEFGAKRSGWRPSLSSP